MISAGLDPRIANSTWAAREFIRGVGGQADDEQLYFSPAAFDPLTQDRLPNYSFTSACQDGKPVVIGKWL